MPTPDTVTGSRERELAEFLERFVAELQPLELEHNPELASLKGFKALAGTDGLSVYDNDSLASLEGLESLARVGVLVVRDNDALLDVDALEAFETAVIGPESVTGGDGVTELATGRA